MGIRVNKNSQNFLDAIQKILIIKPSSLGDIVHSLPLLYRIKNSLDCTVHWIVARQFKDILEGHPLIDKLWVINKDDWKNINKLGVTLEELKKLFRDLRAERYDLVIDLQGLLRSGIIAKATGSRIRIGLLGAREGARFFYTHIVNVKRDIHAVDRYLTVSDFLSLRGNDILFPLPELKDLKLDGVTELLRDDYAVIAPGARWASKMWPPERFGEVASMLPLRSIVVGGSQDIPIAERVVMTSNGRAISISGRTGIKELINVIKGAKFMLCNDSGPMHIASAVGIPVFTIFGPTDPLKTGPYGIGHTIIRHKVSCSPCRKRRCDDMRCMTELKATTVYEIIKEKGEVKV